MGRIMAFDYGLKRCGIAITDELQLIASGLQTVDTPKVFRFLHDYLKHENVELFVVGLPTQMNGQPSESTHIIEHFVTQLESTYGNIPVYRIDERFTSKMAFDAMLVGGLSKKKRQNKALVDEISATLILQNYLASQS